MSSNSVKSKSKGRASAASSKKKRKLLDPATTRAASSNTDRATDQHSAKKAKKPSSLKKRTGQGEQKKEKGILWPADNKLETTYALNKSDHARMSRAGFGRTPSGMTAPPPTYDDEGNEEEEEEKDGRANENHTVSEAEHELRRSLGQLMEIHTPQWFTDFFLSPRDVLRWEMPDGTLQPSQQIHVDLCGGRFSFSLKTPTKWTIQQKEVKKQISCSAALKLANLLLYKSYHALNTLGQPVPCSINALAEGDAWPDYTNLTSASGNPRGFDIPMTKVARLSNSLSYTDLELQLHFCTMDARARAEHMLARLDALPSDVRSKLWATLEQHSYRPKNSKTLSAVHLIAVGMQGTAFIRAVAKAEQAAANE
jgi:hypothetical protein